MANNIVNGAQYSPASMSIFKTLKDFETIMRKNSNKQNMNTSLIFPPHIDISHIRQAVLKKLQHNKLSPYSLNHIP